MAEKFETGGRDVNSAEILTRAKDP